MSRPASTGMTSTSTAPDAVVETEEATFDRRDVDVDAPDSVNEDDEATLIGTTPADRRLLLSTLPRIAWSDGTRMSRDRGPTVGGCAIRLGWDAGD